jgi:hypothetical protein
MMFTEIIAVYCEIHTKQINTLHDLCALILRYVRTAEALHYNDGQIN